MTGVPDIRIAIDEIVLHGIPVTDPDAFRAGLIAELTALARGFAADRASGTAPDHPGGTAPVLHGGQVAAGSPTLAADVARSVWGSMIPGGSGSVPGGSGSVPGGSGNVPGGGPR